MIDELTQDAGQYCQLLSEQREVKYSRNEEGKLVSNRPELWSFEEKFQQLVPDCEHLIYRRALEARDVQEVKALMTLLWWGKNSSGVVNGLLHILTNDQHEVHPWAIRSLQLIVLSNRASVSYVEDLFTVLAHEDKQCQDVMGDLLDRLSREQEYRGKIISHKVTILQAIDYANEYGKEIANRILRSVQPGGA